MAGLPPFAKVNVLYWYKEIDDVAYTLAHHLRGLAYEPHLYRYDEEAPLADAPLLFTYAPWGRIQRVAARVEALDPARRPFWIHWSTEDCPDIRLSGAVTRPAGSLLAWMDRLQDKAGVTGWLAQMTPLRWINEHFHKFRYVGAYDNALGSGLMGLLVEYSHVYACYYQSIGMQVEYAPWGLLHETTGSYPPMRPCERDIDVLWIGTRRTRRRSQLLDQVMGDLEARGRRIHIVDGVATPPVYGQERASLLNRAKITLNLLPTWYDSALAYRWPLVAASKSLLVSEVSLPHAPELKPGTHYVAAPVGALVDTICHYLDHPAERQPIIERAYASVTQEQTMQESVQRIMQWAEQRRQAARQGMDTVGLQLVRTGLLFAGFWLWLSNLEVPL